MSQSRKAKTTDGSALEAKSAMDIPPRRSSTARSEARIARLAPDTAANLDLDAAFASLPMSPLPTSLFHRGHTQPAATPMVPSPLAQDAPISRDVLESSQDEYDALIGLFLDEELVEANLAQASDESMDLASHLDASKHSAPSFSSESSADSSGAPMNQQGVIGIIGPDVVEVSLSDSLPGREESPVLQALHAAGAYNPATSAPHNRPFTPQQPFTPQPSLPPNPYSPQTPSLPHLRIHQSPYGSPTPQSKQNPPSQGVELLILGHLPVIANAWSVQYARHVAESTGQPVALLRLNGESLSLEVVYADTEQALALRAGGPTAHLDDAALRARRVAPRLLIRVDETLELDVIEALSATTVDETAAYQPPTLTQITVLAGADPLAVLASYRTIKGLITNPRSALRTTTETPSPQSNVSYQASDDSARAPSLRVAIMGSPQDQATEAATRINRAVQTFLGTSLAEPSCIQRMDACATSLLYRGPWTRAATLLLDEVAEIWSPSHVGFTSRAPLKPEQRPSTTAGGGGGGAFVQESHHKSSHWLGQPSQSHTSKQATPPAFSQRLNIGLHPLTSRCPYCPGIELASGPDGSLHLIAATPQLGGLCEPNQAIGQLLETAAWAEDHGALLVSAHPTLALGKQAAVLHVLTDDPRSVRGILNTGVRVHLIACIAVQGHNTWVCQDLN